MESEVTQEDSGGVFGKFTTSPSPAISHAMRIPGNFVQPQSFPIGSVPYGSLPGSSSIAGSSMVYGMSPEVSHQPIIHFACSKRMGRELT